MPPAKYGEEHPEYYALVDGRHKLDLHGGGPQLCMTNPEVLDVVVDAVLAEIEKNRNTQFDPAVVDAFASLVQSGRLDVIELKRRKQEG